VLDVPRIYGLNGDDHIRKPVTNYSFNDAGEVCRGTAEIVQQIVREGH